MEKQLVNRGRDYYYNRNYAEALFCADSAIGSNDDKGAWLLKGIVLRETNHLQNAIKCLEKSIELGKSDKDSFIEACIENSRAHLASGNYRDADKFAIKALKSRKTISVLRLLGFIAYSEKKYLESEHYYNKAQEKVESKKHKENFSDIYYMLGMLSFLQKEDGHSLEIALKWFKKASNLDKRNALPLLGMVAIFRHKKDEALRDAAVKAAIDADSNLVYASRIDEGVGLAKEGRYNEAIEMFDEAISSDSCFSQLSKINKGLVSLKQEDYLNSINYFDSALYELSNYSALALIGKCFALGKLNDFQGAKKCFENAKDIDNDLEFEKARDLIYLSQSKNKFFFNGYDTDFVRDILNYCRKITKDSDSNDISSPMKARTNFTASEVADAIKLLGWTEEKLAIPEGIDGIELIYEGASRKASVNVYERSGLAREVCLLHYGCKCVSCGIKLSDIYGEIAQGYIHVHHLKQLSDINSEYQIDPIADLRPVCPTCHSIIHLRTPPYSIKEVQEFIKSQREI
jgi:pentatricopeptide repeat protein